MFRCPGKRSPVEPRERRGLTAEEGAAEAGGDFWVTGKFPSGWSGTGDSSSTSALGFGCRVCGLGRRGDYSSCPGEGEGSGCAEPGAGMS